MIICAPTIMSRKIDPEDEFIIIGSGGVWETKTNEFILKKIRNSIIKKIPLKDILSNILDNIC